MWQVVGQTQAVTLLRQSLEAERLAHAYLLVGPEHVGKMTLALNLAQALNCEAGERPCLECPSCRKIATGGHSDVQIIGLMQNEGAAEAKLISIEQIKQLQHSANLPPFEGNCKVFIIDGAELLSTEAANCLLKTLEEPVARVIFILLTADDSRLLTTVISRCQRLELRPMPASEITPLLTDRGVDAARAGLLARLSHGCPGWAIAAVDDETWLRQRDDELDRLQDVINGDDEGRFTWAAQMATRFGQNRGTVYGILDLWLDFWRDIMLVKTGCTDIVTNIDRLDSLIDLASRYRLEQIRDYIESIRTAGEQLRQNANPRLVLEVLALDMPRIKGELEPAARF